MNHPVYGDKVEWEVTFLRNEPGKSNPVFTRWAEESTTAAEEAKEGFQWVYGYWPNCPVLVKQVTTTKEHQ